MDASRKFESRLLLLVVSRPCGRPRFSISELGRWGNSAMFVVALLFPLPHPACKVFSPQPSVPSILIGSLRYQDITLRRSDASLTEVVLARSCLKAAPFSCALEGEGKSVDHPIGRGQIGVVVEPGYSVGLYPGFMRVPDVGS